MLDFFKMMYKIDKPTLFIGATVFTTAVVGLIVAFTTM